MKKNKNILISFSCVLIVFLSNFLIPSGTNGFTKGINFSLTRIWDTENADIVFESRYKYSEFRRRPIVLGFQRKLQDYFNIPYQASFNIINYLGLFAFFLLIPKLVNSITGDSDDSEIIQYYFLLSFPILFAFYGSICTYDDIIQYLLLELFLIFLFQERNILASLFFLTACISRETSLLFIAVVIAFNYKFSKINLSTIFLWTVPLFLYGIFMYFFLDDSMLKETIKFTAERRFNAWKNNTIDFETTRETVTIILLMLGLPIFLLIKEQNVFKSKETNFWSIFSIGFILLNCVIVFISGLIREARLLFIPLLLSIPLSKNGLQQSIEIIIVRLKSYNVIQGVIIVLLSYLISFVWFSPKTVGTGYVFKVYVFVYFIIFLELIFFELSSRVHKKNTLTH